MSRKNQFVILVVLSIFYWASRSVHIDSDIPKWKSFYYSQTDELSYTIGAFNIVYPPDSAHASFAQRDYLPVTLFEDVITAASLSVFGNNYFGLRFPSLLMGYLILLFVFLLFEKRFGVKAALLASGLLLLDTGFLLSNRIAEPTVFRLFAMVAVIYFLNKMVEGRPKAWQFFAAGLLSSFAFLFLYPTNFFIVPATFIFLAVLLFFARKDAAYGAKPWVYYFLSSFICLAVFLLISKRLMGDLNRFSEMIDFSDRVVSSKSRGIVDVLKGFASNVKQIKDASFFFFDPYLLIIGLAALTFFLVAVFKDFQKTRNISLDQIMWIFLVMFLCQTVFLNDYPRKKLLILFPFVIYTLVYLVAYIEKKYSGSGVAKFSFIIAVPVMLLSVFLQFKYVYNRPTYKFKTAMLSLKKYDGKIIAGNLSYAFRLYNNYIPLLDHYAYYHDYDMYQRVLRELSGYKNFAGSIYYAEEKYLKELQDVSLCPADTILPDNPNIPNKITMNVPCGH